MPEIPRWRSAALRAGFTVIEAIAVLSIIALMVAIGYPMLRNGAEQGRVLGIARAVRAGMQLARTEAIRMGVPVVVRADFARDEVVVFVNEDEDSGYVLEETAASRNRTADYVLTRIEVPEDFHIRFWGPADQDPEGKDAVQGFSLTPTGRAAVFLPDGSIRDGGALRVADDRGNFFEVRVASTATGRSEVLKYHPAPPWGGEAGFFPPGRHQTADVPLWEWF